MRLHMFFHGRFKDEPLAWADSRPGSIWVVVNGRVLAVTWGEGRESPWGRPKAKPSAN
jgi:hypothetical protein